MSSSHLATGQRKCSHDAMSLCVGEIIRLILRSQKPFKNKKLNSHQLQLQMK